MNTNTNVLLIALMALLIGGVGGYTLGSMTDKHDGYGMMHDGMMMDELMDERGNNPGRMMNDAAMDMSMMGGMDHSMMMVESEREFLTGMIPHHQEAVDTAKEVIARGGTTPEILQLVENIVAAQEREIADMKQWHEEWYGEPYVADGSYEPMMRELSGLSGAELDRTFLEDMIMHHMGAIMMARSVQPYIEHNEIAVLAEAIIETQADEIAVMRDMLAGL